MAMRLVSAFVLGTALIAGAAMAQDTPPTETAAPPDTIVIEPEPGETPTPPDGDPRSVGERRADRIAFNKCVLRAQNAEPGPGTAGLPELPEDYCARKLGMRNADAVPDSVRNR